MSLDFTKSNTLTCSFRACIRPRQAGSYIHLELNDGTSLSFPVCGKHYDANRGIAGSPTNPMPLTEENWITNV